MNIRVSHYYTFISQLQQLNLLQRVAFDRAGHPRQSTDKVKVSPTSSAGEQNWKLMRFSKRCLRRIFLQSAEKITDVIYLILRSPKIKLTKVATMKDMGWNWYSKTGCDAGALISLIKYEWPTYKIQLMWYVHRHFAILDRASSKSYSISLQKNTRWNLKLMKNKAIAQRIVILTEYGPMNGNWWFTDLR